MKEEKKTGRPPLFSSELGDEICRRLIEIGSLRKVCQADDMPSKTAVFMWLLKAGEKDAPSEYVRFLDQYTRARQISKDYQFDEHWEDIENVARVPVVIDDVPITGPDGKPLMTVTAQSVALARLKHDAFKWQSSKENPKKYGDKVQQEHTGAVAIVKASSLDEKL